MLAGKWQVSSEAGTDLMIAFSGPYIFLSACSMSEVSQTFLLYSFRCMKIYVLSGCCTHRRSAIRVLLVTYLVPDWFMEDSSVCCAVWRFAKEWAHQILINTRQVLQRQSHTHRISKLGLKELHHPLLWIIWHVLYFWISYLLCLYLALVMLKHISCPCRSIVFLLSLQEIRRFSTARIIFSGLFSAAKNYGKNRQKYMDRRK
jgi:hypothetical protein